MAAIRSVVLGVACTMQFVLTASLDAQPASKQQETQIREKLAELRKRLEHFHQGRSVNRRLIADVEVYAKAAEWILRHNEFYFPRQRDGKQQASQYPQYALEALETGLKRATELSNVRPSWADQAGTVIHGYYSKVDESVQPYALALPDGVNLRASKRWPLHVKLHGRGGTRNEVRFIHDHDNKPLPEDQDWIQLDVFGRTDNAYRWSGETDVFEAIADVKRRFRIDEQRITLWGFSMGGAGSWHLGLHYPSKWSSVGPGAGFVDFYDYQNQTEKRPPVQHATLHIYDAIDYALNAFNVPICTYGGELDKQLVASTKMVEQAKSQDVPMKLLIGAGMGHKFHPQSFKEFMDFHLENSRRGRKGYPGLKQIRFVTYTPKYNQCEWLTIESMIEMYKPAIVDGQVDPATRVLKLKTQNVAALQIARDIAQQIEIDGERLDLATAAGSLLPGVYYQFVGGQWVAMSYEESRAFAENSQLQKRHNLQGPIDDAFMEPFVCVRPTGTPWSAEQLEWANWTLDRFGREFDKWLRGKIPVVDDTDVSAGEIAYKNLILFGDPASNSVIAKVIDKLPVKWTKAGMIVNGKNYDPSEYGMSLIYPNPLNPKRYVVINSGHTIHEKDFLASNSWLFPRLGDIAIQKFEKLPNESYGEVIDWSALFDASWQLPDKAPDPADKSRRRS